MKKYTHFFLLVIIALSMSMCNEPEKNNRHDHHAMVAADSSMMNDTSNIKHSCLMPVSAADSAKFISKQVQVTGDVEHPLTLTVDSLKKMNVVTIENFVVVCQSGANMKEDKTCKGVLLKDILEKAVIRQENHKDRNFYIVARATDNYKATFSWAEIFNNPTGENVYVLFEENGKPIRAEGDMILICRNDIKTGPRHVYWLKSIEVNRVE